MIRRATLLIALAMLTWSPQGLARDSLEDKRLPVIGPAAPFTLTSHEGKRVRLADFRGKVVAVTFIFTGCSATCPLLTQKMVEIQDALGADFGTRINFVSISLDPERDTPQVLKEYAQSWGAKPGWSFLTGSPEAVRALTRRYGIYAAKQKDGLIDHTGLTSLIDVNGQVRVQYLGHRFDPDELRRDLLILLGQE